MRKESKSRWALRPLPLGVYIWMHYGIMLLPIVALVVWAIIEHSWLLLWLSLVFSVGVAGIKYKLSRDIEKAVDRLVAQAQAVASGQPIEPLRTPFLEINVLSKAFADAGDQRMLIVRELQHRIGNMLGKVQALAGGAIRTSASLKEAQERVNETIQTLSRINTLLVSNDMRGATLRQVLERELEPYQAHFRIFLAGDDVMLGRQAAEHLGVAFHELATNALKHGSLQSDEGRVDVSWRVADGRCVLSWVESGGPPLTPGHHKDGFGSTLLSAMLRDLRATMDRRLESEGLRLTLTFPYPAQ